MKKLNVLYSALLAVLLLSLPSLTQAQEEEEEGSASSFTVTLNQDVFFGFYPAIFGGTELSDKIDLTYYGIMWTAGGLAPAGSGLWTEFGAGINYKAGIVDINPQIGVLNGSLLSNGAYPRFFDGIVPNLTVNLNHDKLEGQFYLGWYQSILTGKSGTRDADGKLEDAAYTNNYLHYWVNLGYKATDWLSMGAHAEHLYYVPGNIDSDIKDTPQEPTSGDVYQWVGPYFQFSHADGHSLRFSTGFQTHPDGLADDQDRGDATFYKLTASFGF